VLAVAGGIAVFPSRPSAERSSSVGEARPVDAAYRPRPVAAGSAESCLRVVVVGAATCPPFWNGGDNGGATWRGVTDDSIELVFFSAAQNAQVAGVVGGTAPTASQTEDMLESYERWYNAAYQTYGRRIEITFEQADGTNEPSGAQAVAQGLAEDVGAFAVVGQSLGQVLQEELARREVISSGLINQYGADVYEDNAPYIYGIFPDVDLVLEHVAEYYCKRLDGRRAVHAGDADLRGSDRRLGIVHTAGLHEAGPQLRDLVEDCGGTVARVVEYAPEVEVATQQWTNTMLQLEQSGATTVVCLCDPVAPAFGTAAADAQGYFPEILSTGYGALDTYQAGQLYSQDQWRHMFGPAVVPRPADGEPTDSDAYRAYAWQHASPDPSLAPFLSQTYTLLNLIVSGIERAGPDLDPGTFRDGLFSGGGPTSGGPADPTSPTISLGPHGPSPWTAIDNLTEIWWDPEREAANGKSGRPFYVDGGLRYDLGDWPATDPEVFVDDGSPQGDDP
jgi:hypothetical protein